MILAKIDVTKIDKAKLYKGEKGTYLDICLIETPDGKYGNDFMITQSISKADREAGQKGAILGNAKYSGGRPAPASAPRQQPPAGASPERHYTPEARPATKPGAMDDDPDSIPF